MVSHVTTIYSQLIFILNDVSFLFFQRIKRQKWECFSSIRKKNYLSYLLPRRKRLYSCQDEWDHLDNLRTWTTGWMKRCWRFPSEHLHGLLYSLLTRKLVEIRSKYGYKLLVRPIICVWKTKLLRLSTTSSSEKFDFCYRQSNGRQLIQLLPCVVSLSELCSTI